MVKKAKAIVSRYQVSKGMIFNFPLPVKYIVLVMLGFIFYANSIGNKYALDDNATILKNTYVQMGIAGIPKILTHDSYACYYAHLGGDPSSTQLAGGRYRPLSEIIFALEQQLSGNSRLLPNFRHLINILAFVACILALFYFLEKFLLRNSPMGADWAFLSTILFVIHPIHTEVVANIKSLDEILSMSFILLTFIFSLLYLQSNKIKHLVLGLSSFFLALLSKEYAIVLLILLPFLFYITGTRKPVPALKAAMPYFVVFIIYLLLRFNAVGFKSNIQSANILTNPYFFASHAQKIATEWFVLGKYFGLLLFPYPLACDYSYNQITYHNFSDITVLLSVCIYISLLVWVIFLTHGHNVLAFALLFFLFSIFIISNFLVDIGATMGERLVFHSSMGFVIIISYLLLKASVTLRLQTKKIFVKGIIAIAGILCFHETTGRNSQWKDDNTLFIHDVEVVQNSCMVNSNAGADYLELSVKNGLTSVLAKAYHDSARKFLLRAIHLNPGFDDAYVNLEGVYLQEGLLDSAAYCYEMVKKINPSYPELNTKYAQLFFTRGLHLAVRSGRPREGIGFMKKALLIDSANADIWYNLGIAYYHTHQYDSSRYAFIKTLQNKPDSMDETNARKDLEALEKMK